MNSFATSNLTSGLEEASHSIARNAEDPVRMTTARENFANTATSSRGRKRTHGLIFVGNHRNSNNRYTRYVRSRKYANDPYSQQNPMTRQWTSMRKARFHDERRDEFVKALDTKSPMKIVKIVNSGYKPPKDLVLSAIKAVACKHGGLKAIDTIFKAAARPDDIKDAYDVIFECEPKRGKSLLDLYLRYGIKMSASHSIDSNRYYAKLLNFAINNGSSFKALMNIWEPSGMRLYILSDLLRLQSREHKGKMPTRLHDFFSLVKFTNVEKGQIYDGVMQYEPYPAKIVRWLVEDLKMPIEKGHVMRALDYHNIPVAMYLLSKRQWTDDDKLEILKHVNRSSTLNRDPRKRNIIRIIERTLNDKLNSYTPKTSGSMVSIDNLQNGDRLIFGRMNKTPNIVNVIRRSGMVLLTNNKTRMRNPPIKITSQKELDRFMNRRGVFRGIRSSTHWHQKSRLVPPRTDPINLGNVHYKKANAAARKIQDAWKRAHLKL